MSQRAILDFGFQVGGSAGFVIRLICRFGTAKYHVNLIDGLSDGFEDVEPYDAALLGEEPRRDVSAERRLVRKR